MRSTARARAIAASFTTLSTDANLGNLTLSVGALNPVFAGSTTSYTASVANAVDSITVTPTAAQADATIQVRVNGGSYAGVASGSASGPLALNVGGRKLGSRRREEALALRRGRTR